MSEHWIHRLHKLSLDQLDDLLKEVGPAAPLTREFNIKSLMSRLQGLNRAIAVTLVMSTKSTLLGSNQGDPTADALAQQMIKCRFNLTELGDISLFCGEEGLKTFERAVDRYKRDPVFKGTSEMVQSLLLRGLENQISAENDGNKYTDEQVQSDIETHADQYSEMMRTRQWLRDEFNIESRKDYAYMLQALRITYKSDKAKWASSSRADLNALTRSAFRLYKAAKLYPCSPQTLVDWRKIKSQPLSPNSIYLRPDGVQIWGSGDLVIYDKNNNPRRPIDTIFGLKMPEGAVPLDTEMEAMIDKAFPENQTFVL